MRIILSTLSALAVLGVTGTWVAFTDRPTTEPAVCGEDGLAVETVIPEQVTEVTTERQYTGTIVAARRTRLAFERSARLIRVLFDDGDVVAAGQVLAMIDQRQLETSLCEWNARAAQQAAILAELQAGPRTEVISAKQAEVTALSADAKLRKATYDRTQDLFERKATSLQTLDEVRLAWESAVARRDAAARQWDELRAGTRAEQVTAQEAVVAEIDARIRQLRIDLQDSSLQAPFAGTIVKRMADEGDFLSSQQPVFELVETDVLEARIGLPANQVGHLETGDYVRLSAGGMDFTGTAKRVVPRVDSATRTQTVVIAIDRPHPPGLADGQLVRMPVQEARSVHGFRVPLTALAAASRGLWSVYVVEASEGLPAGCGELKGRTVEVLHTDAVMAVVRGAIYPGDRIVASGVHRVVPRQRVTWNVTRSPGKE